MKFPAALCDLLAAEKVNLPFFTCGTAASDCWMAVAVDGRNAARACRLVEEHFGKGSSSPGQSSILSIFPHRNNPEVMAAFLTIFDKSGIQPGPFAQSSSAISVVLPEKCILETTAALFEPFTFGAYRTPADWKLAQEGKEQLYREVVASYQEKRPKVYALEWQDDQEFLQIRLDPGKLTPVSRLFKSLSNLQVFFTFLVTSPTIGDQPPTLLFSLPESLKQRYASVVDDLPAGALMNRISPVAIFSMNGPHFGDRYGIASELLRCTGKVPAALLAASCSIASVSGVVPAAHIHDTIRAIQESFEVPSVIKKG